MIKILSIVIIVLGICLLPVFTSCTEQPAAPLTTNEIPPPPFMKPPENATDKPVIQAFDISPDVIKLHLNQRATIHWNVTDAASVHISNIGYVPAIGSTLAGPEETTVFTITATNSFGTISLSKQLNVLP